MQPPPLAAPAGPTLRLAARRCGSLPASRLRPPLPPPSRARAPTAPPAMLPCTWCTIFLLPCSPDHSMPDIILDLNLLVFAARAMEPAQEKPHVTPFTLDKRDTKDLATLVLNKSQNKRRRLDKNPKHKLRSLPPAAPLSLSCRLARAASCLCLLSPVRSRSRRRSLALARRARCSTSSRTEKGASEQEPRAKNPRALPLSRAASGSLSLSCAASLVLPLARAPSLLSQAGTDGRWARRSRAGGRSAGTLPADWARCARSDFAPGAHGDRDGDDGTSCGANSHCSSAFHSAAVCCLPPRSLSPPLSLVCPSTVRLP